MKFDRIYIISYFPNDEMRSARKELHKKQLQYWKDKNIDIFIYAQHYKDEDFQNGITYIGNNLGEVKLPGSARNECLKHFYNTDLDFTVIFDDDVILYEGSKYCDSDNLINILKNINISQLEGVDVFDILNPTQTPFAAYYKEKEELLLSNLVFLSKSNISGQSIFVRNAKKFYNEEWYYIDLKNDDGSIKGGEDVYFGVDLIKRGKGVFTCKNFVRKDLGWTKSTWCENNDVRKDTHENIKIMAQEWGVPEKNGMLQWKKLCNINNIPKEILAHKTKIKKDITEILF